MDLNETDKTFWCRLCGVRHRKNSPKGKVHHEWLTGLEAHRKKSGLWEEN